MRDALTHSQRLSITLRYLATDDNSKDLKIVGGYITINWNYCAGDVYTARLTDGS